MYFIFFISLILTSQLFAKGLYKLENYSPLLVPNAKEGIVYLFQFPRTARMANHCVHCLALEAWLKFEKIPFHRISNQFMLGSTEGEVPFIQYNGEYINGFNEIISKLKQKEQQETECISIGGSIGGGSSLGFSSPYGSTTDNSSLDTLSSSQSINASSNPIPIPLASPASTASVPISPSSSISSFPSLSSFSPHSLQNSPLGQKIKHLGKSKTFGSFGNLRKKAACLFQLDDESMKVKQLQVANRIEKSILEIYKILLKDRVSGDGLNFLMNDIIVQEPILALKFAQDPIKTVSPIGTELGTETEIFPVKNKGKCSEIVEFGQEEECNEGPKSTGFRILLNSNFWHDYFEMSKIESRGLPEKIELISKYKAKGTETGFLPLESSLPLKNVMKEEEYQPSKIKKYSRNFKMRGTSSSSGASSWWDMERKHDLGEQDWILFKNWIDPLVNQTIWNEIKATKESSQPKDSWEAELKTYLKTEKVNKHWRDGFINYSINTNFMEMDNVQLKNYFDYEMVPIIKQLKKREEKEYKFLFGNEPTVTDALLFGLLYQFFQITLNITELKEYFEQIAGAYPPYDLGYKESDVKLMDHFVKTVQDELGWKGKFRPTTEPLYPLNFEKDYEGAEKYNGPFDLTTDSLDWLPNIFIKITEPKEFDGFSKNRKNKEILDFIVQKLMDYAEKEWKWSQIHFKKLIVPLMYWASAYLCDIGKNTECQNSHKIRGKAILQHVKIGEIENEKMLKDSINTFNNNSLSWEEKFNNQVGKIVHLAVVEFNDKLVAKNVEAAVLEAMKKVEINKLVCC